MNANKLLDEVRKGKRILIKSYTKPMFIDAKCLAKWDKAGIDLLVDENNGYRLRQGKGSVYLFSSHLELVN